MRRHWMWVFAGTAILSAAASANAENWPRFRGPDGSGVSDEKGIPVAWDAKQVAWATELPGVGHAAPIIWDRHLFVTSATADTGALRELFALDAITGDVLWSRDGLRSRSQASVELVCLQHAGDRRGTSLRRLCR